MARARNIKPAFFQNEYLAEVSPAARLLFIGLWTLADSEGRLEDRPKRIKAALFPFDTYDIDQLLDELVNCKGEFLIRYEVDGVKCIEILNFKKHQHPHLSERQLGSKLPAIPPKKAGSVPEKAGLVGRENEITPYQSGGIPITESLKPHTEPLPPQTEKTGSGGFFFEIENRGQRLTEDEWIYRNLMEHRRNKGWKSEGAINLQSLLSLYPNHLEQFRSWSTLPIARRIAAYAFAAIKVTPDNHFKYALKMARDGTGEEFEKFLLQAQKQVDAKDYLVRIN